MSSYEIGGKVGAIGVAVIMRPVLKWIGLRLVPEIAGFNATVCKGQERFPKIMHVILVLPIFLRNALQPQDAARAAASSLTT